MDLTPTPEQLELAGAVRRVCSRWFTRERVRAAETTAGIDADGWRALDEAGVFGLLTSSLSRTTVPFLVF